MGKLKIKSKKCSICKNAIENITDAKKINTTKPVTKYVCKPCHNQIK